MGKYSEAFVAFDVAKKKHAVAIADGGRGGEVRFLGDVENSPATIERMISKLADRYGRCTSAMKRGRPDTGCTARFRLSATTAWWSLRR